MSKFSDGWDNLHWISIKLWLEFWLTFEAFIFLFSLAENYEIDFFVDMYVSKAVSEDLNGKLMVKCTSCPHPLLTVYFGVDFLVISLMFRLFPQEDQSPFIEHSLFFLVCVFVRNNFKLVLNLLVTPSAYLDDTHFLFDSNVWKTLHLWRWTWCWKVCFPFGFPE